MRVAVVLGPRTHGLLMRDERHRQTTALRRPRRCGVARRLVADLKLLHALQEIPHLLACRIRRCRLVELRDALVDELKALLATEHLGAHDLHHLLRQQAFDHGQNGALRRVVENSNLGLGGCAEEGGTRGLPEAGRYHDRSRQLALAHLLPGFIRRQVHRVQRAVGLQTADDLAADVAVVLRSYADLDLAVVRPPGPAKEKAEEGAEHDGHEQSQHQGTPVRQKQDQVFAHKRDQCSHGAGASIQVQSRSVRPVSVRKTSSSRVCVVLK